MKLFSNFEKLSFNFEAGQRVPSTSSVIRGWTAGWTLSQESRAGTRNTGPIVNSSETLSFDPSSPVSNRVVRLWSSARSQFRRIPIAPYNELLGRAHPAFPPSSLFPPVHSCFWVFYASGELYLRGEWSLTWINCISLPAASPFADSSTDDSWWSNQGTEMHQWHSFSLCFVIFRVPFGSFQLGGFRLNRGFFKAEVFFFLVSVNWRTIRWNWIVVEESWQVLSSQGWTMLTFVERAVTMCATQV